MLRYLLTFIALALCTPLLHAQLKIIGSNFDLGSGTINVLRWNAETGTVLDSVPTPTSGIAMGSSVFDAYLGRYYFSDGLGLNSVQFTPGIFTAYLTTQISTSAEIDMANGKIYGVGQTNVLDSNGTYVSSHMDLFEYNIGNNTDTVLGTFTGNQGVYLDASCYNSNLGIYYFVGEDSLLGQCLYAVNTRASTFAFALVPLNLTSMFALTLEYDNQNDILYGLMMDNSIPNTTHFLVQQIDPLSGALTLEVDFPQFSSYQVGTCSFHQATGSMVFVFPDTSGTTLRIYNTLTDSLTTGFLPITNIFEFECDNTEFAASKYNTTAAASPLQPARLKLFPNPVTQELHYVSAEKVVQLQVIDVVGKVTAMPVSEGMSAIDVSRLAPGHYVLRSQSDAGDWMQAKFIKQ
jgi:hypothetical protein